MSFVRLAVTLAVAAAFVPAALHGAARPNVVLVMADDQGWGQTGYYGHPVLKTPNLDTMAANGLRFDRFYAGAPVCSPTRATVLTGRTNDRTGVASHGHALRLQERVLPTAMKQAGYATGHFGKWHLNGLRGPGVPILADDDHNPGAFGFDEWLSVTNFFDRDPIMSRRGTFEEFKGDSSEIIVEEALAFMGRQVGRKRPFLAVIWYGTPHSPWRAADDDKVPFGELETKAQEHYGELAAMDRSIGALRRGLRQLGAADNTLVWYCSDNGGLKPFGPATVGGLRGWKGTVYEGGLRVPGIVEWPAAIPEPRVTAFPAGTVDIFPTLVDILGLSADVLLQPVDGMSLKALFAGKLDRRPTPLGFRHNGRSAWIDNEWKLVQVNKKDRSNYALYNLIDDPKETQNVVAEHPDVARRLRREFEAWNASVNDSVTGLNYPEGHVSPDEPPSRFWTEVPEYRPYFDAWRDRPEYSGRLRKKRR